MVKNFVPFEFSVKLKDLGFDEKCFGVYYNKDGDVRICDGNETGDAPLWQQAFEWFRERYNIDGIIQIEPLNKKYGYVIYKRDNQNYKEAKRDKTYEEARLTCLKELIKIV